MRNIRTCSHIKVNGVKCGSPALRHQTLCYFHYQWDRRERRRVRLGGPVGTNKNTGIDFPILEGPESIMIALMEVQHALLDARIDRLTAHTLLYSIQLAMQLKISTFTGLSSRLQSVTTCPELEADLDLDRARGLRPSAVTCSTCPDTDSCVDSEHCPSMGALAPRRPRDPMDQPLVAPLKPAVGLSGVVAPPFFGSPDLRFIGCSSVPPISGSPVAVPCHPERSPQGGVEGPFVSSPEATPPDFCPTLDTSSIPVVETRNLRLETTQVAAKIEAAATPERKQKALRLRATLPRSAQGDTSTRVGYRQTKTERQERGRTAHPALKGGATSESPLQDFASANG